MTRDYPGYNCCQQQVSGQMRSGKVTMSKMRAMVGQINFRKYPMKIPDED